MELGHAEFVLHVNLFCPSSFSEQCEQVDVLSGWRRVWKHLKSAFLHIAAFCLPSLPLLSLPIFPHHLFFRIRDLFFIFLIHFESWVTFSASKRFLCCCKMYCKIVMHNYTQPFPSGSLPSLPLPSQTSSLSLPFAILLYLSRALALPMEMTMMLQQCRAAGKERN